MVNLAIFYDESAVSNDKFHYILHLLFFFYLLMLSLNTIKHLGEKWFLFIPPTHSLYFQGQ